MIITGPSKLLELINVQQSLLRMSDRRICIATGKGDAIINKMRCNPDKDVHLATAVALLDVLGFDLVAVPKGQYK